MKGLFIGGSLEGGVRRGERDSLNRFGTLTAKGASHQFDKVEAGAFGLFSQIGFAVTKTIFRGLLPASFVHAFDSEEKEAAPFQTLGDTGENGGEIADIDHGIGSEDEIVSAPGFR